MVSSLLRLLSLLCIVALVVSFGAFASDQAGHGSKETVAKIADADTVATAASVEPAQPKVNIDQANPAPRIERVREQSHGKVREAADDVNDVLTSWFTGAASPDDIWKQRIVTTLLAFLVFGVGIGFLGRVAATKGV